MKRLIIVSVLLVAGSLGGGIYWLRQPVQRPAVTIDASREPKLGLPVYAQFVATQSLNMEETPFVSKLLVPMYLQAVSPPATIRLIRNQKLIQEWLTPAGQEGIVEAEFILHYPQLLDGDIEVQFDGTAISHNQKDIAPRVFIESFDEAFPHGNYRIAQNEKKGDLSLTLFEQKTRGQLFWEGLQENPLPHLARIGVWLAALILIGVVPYVLVPVAARTHSDTSQQTF